MPAIRLDIKDKLRLQLTERGLFDQLSEFGCA
jgi:hypothetical protein